MYESFQIKFAKVFTSSCRRPQNLNTLLYGKDQTAIKTKNVSDWISFERGKEVIVDRKDGGHVNRKEESLWVFGEGEYREQYCSEFLDSFDTELKET